MTGQNRAGWFHSRLLLVALLLPSCSEGGSSPVTEPDTRPNVLIIVVDSLRADHLTQYGYGLPTSEPLDGLISRATRFEECYTPSPWTVPSTASIMSGQMPSRHRALARGDALRQEVETLAETLGAAGWRTAGFSHNHQISARTSFDQGFDFFADYDGEVLSYPDVSEMIAPAIRWIGEGDGPFFLYMQPMNCHGPYRVPESRRSDLLGRPPVDGFSYYDEIMSDIMWRRKLERRKDVDAPYLESLAEQYDTAVRYVTGEIARLLGHLERAGILDNTLVIITADHGEELFDHGGFSHGYSLHREVLHVPLVVKLPRQKVGRVARGRVSLLDVHPTVLAVVGLEPAVPLDGFSLARLLRRTFLPSWMEARRELVFEVGWQGRCVARSLLSGGLKLVAVESNYEGVRDTVHLYDVRADRDEEVDLALGQPGSLVDLERRLDARFKVWDPFVGVASKNVLDNMNEEALRSLGYIQ